MIVLRTYNVIFLKFKADDKVSGGARALLSAITETDIQEDEYLISVGVKNATEVRECMGTLLEMGLSFDDSAGSSEDFTVFAKEGIWWPAAWLVNNGESCWFIADVESPV